MQQYFKQDMRLFKRLLQKQNELLALNLEGLTVCALVHRRVSLVRTYVDFVQRAIIFLSAMEFTLRYAAADCMVRFTCHNHSPPYGISITSGQMFYSQ